MFVYLKWLNKLKWLPTAVSQISNRVVLCIYKQIEN